ncbi:DsbA family oxidoreductase [Trueperella pyogenes]|uniref:DsbA family oxidoreductase n=1 Tax=Trueperella pyogenes TaxID=1661 RepID=A0A3Q9GMR0_9ACTO|nr:DsbA family oxidoreductase [Trueperella pyogenes]AWG03662.1 disulfide bond formation protein DsbA [Trueperella pyogenes]AWG16393.1 disulfide bond formation protein DsbA [Trueperella pyogenes]AZR05273.1 DsbA family oxidoreductase [Trueperella pyogenes]AZR07095.1 DsbA family oxidoreductase [Trueperella pyogenes]MCI7689696.1 DsbA family oxidoreductase [Trueperella pyogenes]
MEHDIVVHVWFDIACPWCWIGKQRLQKGIAQSGQKVAVEYHSYQLQPDAVGTALPYAELLSHKASSCDEAQVLDKTSDLACAEGLTLNWASVAEVNTFLAHQLVYAAKSRGRTPEEAARLGADAVERLFVAHFTECRNLSDTDTLVALASELGLDGDEVADELESGEHADAVRSDIRDAHTLGITGVPFYVIGGKFGISGVQSPQVYADAITRAVAELQVEQAKEMPVTQ